MKVFLSKVTHNTSTYLIYNYGEASDHSLQFMVNYIYATVSARHEAIMLQNLSIILLSSAPKITYCAFEEMPIIPKIMPLILANNVIL